MLEESTHSDGSAIFILNVPTPLYLFFRNLLLNLTLYFLGINAIALLIAAI